MKLAIIDNGSNRITELTQAFARDDVSVIDYGGTLDWDYLNGFEAVVLSGSSKNQAYDPAYDAEVEFIKYYDKPILGICLGLELICLAHDLPIYQLPKRVEGAMPITVLEDYAEIFGHNHTVHEKHKWVAQTVNDDFNVMFISDTGIEGLVHKTKPIIGVQFHPEVIDSVDHSPITAPQLLQHVMSRHPEPVAP